MALQHFIILIRNFGAWNVKVRRVKDDFVIDPANRESRSIPYYPNVDFRSPEENNSMGDYSEITEGGSLLMYANNSDSVLSTPIVFGLEHAFFCPKFSNPDFYTLLTVPMQNTSLCNRFVLQLQQFKVNK